MKFSLVFFFSIPAVLGTQYNCSTDGTPSVLIVAGSGNSNPARELNFSLIPDCIGDRTDGISFITAPFEVFANCLWMTSVADQDELSGTDVALRLQKIFPIDEINCLVSVEGENSTTPLNSTTPAYINSDKTSAYINRLGCSFFQVNGENVA
jgi:hypothetical protein